MSDELPELCAAGEGRPPGDGSHVMVWGCPKCRLAWVAAVLDGQSMPYDPRRHAEIGERVGEFYDDPFMIVAARALAARCSEGDPA